MPPPLYGCSCGILGPALACLLILSAPQLMPDRMYFQPTPVKPKAPPPPLTWGEHLLIISQFRPLHMFVTFILFMFGLITSLCGFIQRKIMERRLLKMNQYLHKSVERLKHLDTKQEQLENTLKLVQNATAEYNLLLYLLQRNRGAGH